MRWNSGLGAPWLVQTMTSLYGRKGVADAMPNLANLVISNVPGPRRHGLRLHHGALGHTGRPRAIGRASLSAGRTRCKLGYCLAKRALRKAVLKRALKPERAPSRNRAF